jgi:hypothetical protein
MSAIFGNNVENARGLGRRGARERQSTTPNGEGLNDDPLWPFFGAGAASHRGVPGQSPAPVVTR